MATIKTISSVTHDLTANWNKYPKFIPKAGEIIVYDDRYTKIDGNGNTVNVPGIKIGNGNAYLIDMPFVGDKADSSGLNLDEVIKMVQEHEINKDIHVTPEEKEFWNNKLNLKIDDETLVFTVD